MNKLIINGGNKLTGNITLNGYKHSVIPIIASSLLTDKTIIIKNVPRIMDTFVLNKILNEIGVSAIFKNHTLKISAKNITLRDKLISNSVSSIHGSLYLLPALLTRLGKIKISFPGGCKIGRRPIMNVVFILRTFGAKVKFRNGTVEAHFFKRPVATKINLNFKYNKYYSGATKSALIIGSLAKGITTIKNAFKAPEIIELAGFLKKMGADIKGEGSDEIIINGTENLKGCECEIMPDLIELGTFIGAAAITQSPITIKHLPKSSLEYFKWHMLAFSKMGISFLEKNGNLKISCDNKLKSAKIIVESYPGISTDLQPIFCALMVVSKGTSEIEERVWEKRFAHVKELRKMGAKISVNNNKLIIEGIEKLKGNEVHASDLRGAAALVLASLSAEGKTIINNPFHLERGYECFIEKLKRLNANIAMIK